LGAAGRGIYDGIFTKAVEGAIAGNTAIAFSQLLPADVNYRGSVIIANNPALNPS
jgi:hypothetical protein